MWTIKLLLWSITIQYDSNTGSLEFTVVTVFLNSKNCDITILKYVAPGSPFLYSQFISTYGGNHLFNLIKLDSHKIRLGKHKKWAVCRYFEINDLRTVHNSIISDGLSDRIEHANIIFAIFILPFRGVTIVIKKLISSSYCSKWFMFRRSFNVMRFVVFWFLCLDRHVDSTDSIKYKEINNFNLNWSKYRNRIDVV